MLFSEGVNRREWWRATAGATLTLFGGASVARAAYPRRFVQQITDGFRPLWREEGGGYGWESESEAHVTPTFSVIGCHRVLGADVPNREKLVPFLHNYPVRETRRTERPLWTFDYQQVQALQWLGA